MPRRAMLLLGPALAACALAACTRPATVAPDTVGPGYVTGGGTWSTGGGITVAARALDRGGVTAICGAWTMDRQSALSLLQNRDVLEAGGIELGGRPVLRGLGFLPEVPYAADITGAPAACAATALPWRAAYATAPLRIRLPWMNFVVNRDSPAIAGFRPGPRPPILP